MKNESYPKHFENHISIRKEQFKPEHVTVIVCNIYLLDDIACLFPIPGTVAILSFSLFVVISAKFSHQELDLVLVENSFTTLMCVLNGDGDGILALVTTSKT